MNYSERLQRLRLLLASMPCDALLIEHPIHILYLTGLELSTGKVLISKDDASLIVDGRYYERCSHQSLYTVHLLKDDNLKEWIVAHRIHHLGFDQQQTTYQAFLALTKLADQLSASHKLEIVPVESVVQKLRLVKDAEEINCMRKAAKLGYQGYEYVVSLLKEGVGEEELAFELEFFWKKRGAKKLAFDSIIAFGPNSSMPHYRAGSAKLTANTSVLIDIGVVLEHYHSDMTRVVFFGEPPALIRSIYAIVEEAKNRAIALCRPGTLIGELDRTAREWIASNGYGGYFTHSLGHGLGLDIHEPPMVREKGPFAEVPLQAGMVITIEPGIYLPNIGGVRLEDTILIKQDGYENLTEISNPSQGSKM